VCFIVGTEGRERGRGDPYRSGIYLNGSVRMPLFAK
jgi:hypothetical protein